MDARAAEIRLESFAVIAPFLRNSWIRSAVPPKRFTGTPLSAMLGTRSGFNSRAAATSPTKSRIAFGRDPRPIRLRTAHPVFATAQIDAGQVSREKDQRGPRWAVRCGRLKLLPEKRGV